MEAYLQNHNVGILNSSMASPGPDHKAGASPALDQIAPEELVFYPKGGYPHGDASITALCVIPGTIDYAMDPSSILDGYEQSCRYISGDHDGRICIWRLMRTASDDHRLLLAKMFTMAQLAPQLSGYTVKSLFERDGLIVIGNNASEIVEISQDSIEFINYQYDVVDSQAAPVRGNLLGSGHGSGEIWGLAVHPELPVFFTTGDDATLRCWHLHSHALISYAHLGDKSRVVDVRCQETTEDIVIGLNDGSLVIVDLKAFLNPTSKARTGLDVNLMGYNATNNLGLIEDAHGLHVEDSEDAGAYEGSDDEPAEAGSSAKVSNKEKKKKMPALGKFVVDWIVEADRKPAEWVEVVKYSMEGSVLAAGSHDHVVYVYDVRAESMKESPVTKKKFFPLIFKFVDHRDHITHLDFGIFVKVNQHIETTNVEEDAVIPTSNRIPTPTAMLMQEVKVMAGDKLNKSIERYVTEQYDPVKVKITVMTTDVVTMVNKRTGEVVAKDTFTSAIPQAGTVVPARRSAGAATSATATSPVHFSGTSSVQLLNKHQVPDATTREVKLSDICIQSSSAVGELFFWKLNAAANGSFVTNALRTGEIPRAERVTSINAIKDVFWHTFTSPYGWPVQGMWTDDLQVTDILAIDRSHSFEKVPVIAASDAMGRIKIYSYPCVLPNAPDKCYRGHTNKVTNLRFSHDDNFVITTGGPDQCVLVWATDIEDEARQRAVFLSNSSSAPVRNTSDIVVDVMSETSGGGSASNGGDPAASAQELMISKITPGGGDESAILNSAVMAQIAFDQPWKKITYPEPTDAHNIDPALIHSEPDISLDLKYVYGYRGWDCRNNLMFADSRYELVYHIAGVGIVLNTQANTQILNTEHTTDIISLTVHPEGHTVATGEIGKFPRIVLWDANTGITIRSFQGHKRGVSALAFSCDGNMLVSCGLDADHTILVHHTQTGAILGRGKCGRHPINVLCLAVSQAGTIATGGNDFIKFWNLPSLSSTGGELSSKTGIFSLKTVKSQTSVSCAFLGMDCVTGMSDGTLCLWKDRSNTKAILGAHQGAITAMTSVYSITAVSGNTAGNHGTSAAASSSSSSSGSSAGGGGDGVGDETRLPRYLLTGGQDGMIHLRDIQFNLLWSLNMKETTPLSLQPCVQALASRDGRIIIGTKAAEIYEVSLTGSLDAIQHMAGHYQSRGELWGLAVHPKSHCFITCADDQTVRLWDYKKRGMVTIVHTKMACRAVDYHPDGSQIAVTHNDGHLQVLSSDLLTEMSKITASSSWSAAMMYSPDGHLLAIGCRGNDADSSEICLYETKSWSCRAKCRGHTNAVTHLDFSDDGQYLRSVSTNSATAYELFYWSTRDGKIVTNSALIRDTCWATSHCVLGWETQGVWAGRPVDTNGNRSTSSSGRSAGSGSLATTAFASSSSSSAFVSGDSDVIVSCTRSPDNRHLVTGGDSHLIKVFRSPAFDDNFQYKAYKGHVDSIKRVQFSADGKMLFSVGGLDKAILQFEVKTKK
jgi:WD40 repeat protein